jgi:hypothetical protein
MRRSQAARSSPPAKARHASHDKLHITETGNTTGTATGNTVGVTIAARRSPGGCRIGLPSNQSGKRAALRVCDALAAQASSSYRGR